MRGTENAMSSLAMSSIGAVMAEASSDALPFPPVVFAAIAFAVFVFLAFVVWSFRDVASRHSHRTDGPGAHDSGHDAGGHH